MNDPRHSVPRPRRRRPPPRTEVLQSLLALLVGGGLFLLGIFFLPHARWPGFVRVLFLAVTGIAALGGAWGLLRSLARLPARDKWVAAGVLLAAGYAFTHIEFLRTWGAIVGYKLRDAGVQVLSVARNWRARGEVYLVAEDEHLPYRLVPADDGTVLAVMGNSVRRYAISADEEVEREDLLDAPGVREAGAKPTVLTDCAAVGRRLLCLTLFGEVIERQGGGWRKVATFPAPEDQFYDALAVDPASGALFSYTERGRRPARERAGIWRLDPATGRAERISERAPRDLLGGPGGVWALFYGTVERLAGSAPPQRVDIDAQRYGSCRAVSFDPSGTMLVATARAVLAVGEDGRTTELWVDPTADFDVRGVALAPDGRPVLATWDDGLLFDPGDGTMRAFGIRERFWRSHLRDVERGPGDWMWVAANERDLGLVALRWPAFVAWVREQGPARQPAEVRRFADLRQAMEELYPDGVPPDSQALAFPADEVPGGLVVAWYGEPVWPKQLAGLGHRHPRGSVRAPDRFALALRPDRIAVRFDGRRRELQLPPGRVLLRVLLDRRGAVWAGTRAGVLREEATGALRPVENLPAGWVADLAEDARGRVWVAFAPTRREGKTTAGRVLFLESETWRELHADRERFNRYRSHSTGRPGIPCRFVTSTNVEDIHPLDDGRVALATDNGLVLHDGRSARCFHIRESLPSLALARVRVDRSGRIFLFSYGDRVDWFDGRFFIYHTIDRARGLFRRGPADVWVDPDGRAWVLDEDGSVGVAPLRTLY